MLGYSAGRPACLQCVYCGSEGGFIEEEEVGGELRENKSTHPSFFSRVPSPSVSNSFSDIDGGPPRDLLQIGASAEFSRMPKNEIIIVLLLLRTRSHTLNGRRPEVQEEVCAALH